MGGRKDRTSTERTRWNEERTEGEKVEVDGKDGGEGAGMNKRGKGLGAKEGLRGGGMERLSEEGGRKGGNARRKGERKG